jgi:hypothetical protein
MIKIFINFTAEKPIFLSKIFRSLFLLWVIFALIINADTEFSEIAVSRLTFSPNMVLQHALANNLFPIT